MGLFPPPIPIFCLHFLPHLFVYSVVTAVRHIRNYGDRIIPAYQLSLPSWELKQNQKAAIKKKLFCQYYIVLL